MNEDTKYTIMMLGIPIFIFILYLLYNIYIIGDWRCTFTQCRILIN